MLKSKRILVTNTVVELTDGIDTDQEYKIRLRQGGGAGALAIGGADLDSSNGYLADNPEEFTLQGEKLYGIVPIGFGSTVAVSIIAFSV